jgi:putative spermidine/putrescine transport system permease protein
MISARPALLLAPALVVVGGLFLGGLGLGILRSFGVHLWGESSAGLHFYARALAEPGLAGSIGATLWVAIVSTAIATVLGIAAAVLMDKAFRAVRWPQALAVLFQLGLTVPHVVAAVAVGTLIAQSGLISRLTFALGITAQPADFPALTADPWCAGIIIAYVWKEVPFIGLVVLTQLSALGSAPADIARTLGASRWQAFRHVTLPLIAPAVLGAAALVFAFTLGAYEVPAVLGASNPKLLPVVAYEMFTSNDLTDRPAAIALALMTALAAGALILAARLLMPLAAREA